MAVPAGVDHRFDHGGGIDIGDVNAFAVQEAAADGTHENLIAVQVLGGGFRNGGEGTDEVSADRFQVDLFRFGGRRRGVGGLVQGIGGVAHIGSVLAEAFHNTAHLFFGRVRGDFRPGGAETVVKLFIHLDAEGTDVLGPVLVERVADEVEFPAFFGFIRDFPGVRPGSFQHVEQRIQRRVFHFSHYPSLAFAFR